MIRTLVRPKLARCFLSSNGSSRTYRVAVLVRILSGGVDAQVRGYEGASDHAPVC